MKDKTITKQFLLNTIRCPKSTYLHLNHPELMDIQEDSFASENGQAFELVARKLLAPNGIDLKNICANQEQLIEYTFKEVQKEYRVLYQATFITTDKVLAMADIFIKARLKNTLIEIKSSTGPIKAEEIMDAAYQYYVITSSGTKVDEVCIAYVNKQYLKEGDITEDLLIVENITKEVKRVQARIKVWIERIRKTMSRYESPEKEIGEHCLSPYPCAFKGHCWNHLPTNNVFELRHMRIGQKLKLYHRGIVELKDIPVQERLSENQWLQVSCSLENKMIMQLELLRNWIQETNSGDGIYFMDFETIAPAVPLYDNTKPYTQVPFQYSLHFRDNKSATINHYEFLANPKDKTDSRKEFILQLINNTSGCESAPIVVFNMSFEKGRLLELARCFPEYESSLKKIVSRLTDLMIVFREKWYYDARFAGSYSIKAILPVLCPELSYKDLSIGNGTKAMLEYSKLSQVSEKEAKAIRIALLEYCKLDTLAMLKILEALEITCSTIKS